MGFLYSYLHEVGRIGTFHSPLVHWHVRALALMELRGHPPGGGCSWVDALSGGLYSAIIP